jgi:hypothetical protein
MGTGATLTQATRGSILIYMYGNRGNPHTGNQGVHPYTRIWGRGNPHTGGPSLTHMGTGATLTQATRGSIHNTHIWGQGQPSHRQSRGSTLNTYMGTGATLTQANRGPILIHIYGARATHIL